MASGWAGDGAVQDQIQDSINDEVARARRNLPKGESLHFCEAVSYTHLDVYKRQVQGCPQRTVS